MKPNENNGSEIFKTGTSISEPPSWFDSLMKQIVELREERKHPRPKVKITAQEDTISIEPGVVFCRCDKGEPTWPMNRRPQYLIENSLSTIVAAYVWQNQIGTNQLPVLISTVHQTFSGLGKPVAEVGGERTPAVPGRRSVHRDHVVCLDCGWRGQMLRRPIAGHGLSVEQYRARWSLRPDHPITAPGYCK